MLLGEVRDDIDNLNGRPDSTGRCLAAVDVFREQPTEANRTAVREAYEAIPEHLRRYALGDMDRKDFPLRVIVTGPENQIELWNGNTVDVTDEMHASALEYFAEREQLRKQHETKTPADGPTEPVESSVHLNQAVFPRGWPENPGTLVLRNEFPAPIALSNRTYPTVVHAYWALAVADEQRQVEILGAERPYDAQKLAEDSPLRDDWSQVRVAVMTRLLRAKFQQHPEFAETLMATGATRLIYTEIGSTFWGQRGLEGRNWMGRLLELVRSELVAAKLNILP